MAQAQCKKKNCYFIIMCPRKKGVGNSTNLCLKHRSTAALIPHCNYEVLKNGSFKTGQTFCSAKAFDFYISVWIPQDLYRKGYNPMKSLFWRTIAVFQEFFSHPFLCLQCSEWLVLSQMFKQILKSKCVKPENDTIVQNIGDYLWKQTNPLHHSLFLFFIWNAPA